MADSYFDMLTEQQGFPAKTFDALEELKRLRQRLTSRLLNPDPPMENYQHLPTEFTASKWEPPPMESVSLESVVKEVCGMEKTMKKRLATWRRSRSSVRAPLRDIFRGDRKLGNKGRVPSVVAQYLMTPRKGVLETVVAGLMTLGGVAVIFGFLSFFRGGEGDLSLGSLACLSGAAIIAIGIGGNFFASRADV